MPRPSVGGLKPVPCFSPFSLDSQTHKFRGRREAARLSFVPSSTVEEMELRGAAMRGRGGTGTSFSGSMSLRVLPWSWGGAHCLIRPPEVNLHTASPAARTPSREDAVVRVGLTRATAQSTFLLTGAARDFHNDAKNNYNHKGSTRLAFIKSVFQRRKLRLRVKWATPDHTVPSPGCPSGCREPLQGP